MYMGSSKVKIGVTVRAMTTTTMMFDVHNNKINPKWKTIKKMVQKRIVLRGYVYYYCRLKNDTIAITVPSSSSSPVVVVSSSNDVVPSSPQSATTSSSSKKRKRPISSSSLSSLAGITNLHFDVPLVGWIFEYYNNNEYNTGLDTNSVVVNDNNYYPTTTATTNSSSSNTTNNIQYALLCVPQCYESFLCYICQHHYMIELLINNNTVLIIPILHNNSIPTMIKNPQYNDRNNMNSNTSTTSSITNVSSMICILNKNDNKSNKVINAPIRIAKQQQQQRTHYTCPTSLPCLQMKNGSIIIHDGTAVTTNVWTLEQIAKYETSQQYRKVHRHQQQQEVVEGRTTQANKCLYTFYAKVTMISPILSISGKDPFVLLECVSDARSTNNMGDDDDNDNPIHDNNDIDNDEIYYNRFQFHCNIVIRKDGLVQHSSIVPNSYILFHNVKKQRWRISDSILEQLSNTTTTTTNKSKNTTTKLIIPPPSVFVVDSVHQIMILKDSCNNIINNNNLEYQSIRCLDLVFDNAEKQITNDTTTTLIGSIRKIQFLHRRFVPSKQEHFNNQPKSLRHHKLLHSIEIQESSSQQKILVNTLHYPISTSLYLLLLIVNEHKECDTNHQLPLLFNIHVQISNLQCLGYNRYVATLQTHFDILKIDYDSMHYAKMIHKSQILLNLSSFPNPFDIMKINSTIINPIASNTSTQHLKWACDDLILQNKIYYSDFLVKSSSVHNNTEIPSLDDISLAFLGIIRPNSGLSISNTSRNVYVEFFTRPSYITIDVNCDDIDDENTNHRISTPCIDLPYPISIAAIKRYAIKDFSKQLRLLCNESRHNDCNEIKSGWTCSKQYIGPIMYDVFVHGTQYKINTYDSTKEVMYAFGYCSISSHVNGQPYISISDDFVTLPIVYLDTLPVKVRSNSNNIDTPFCWVGIRGIIASCICLGRLSVTYDDANLNRSAGQDTQYKNLPPYTITSDSQSSDSGACGIFVMEGHVFMVSVLLVCDQYHEVRSDKSESYSNSSECSKQSTSPRSVTLEQCLSPASWTNTDTFDGVSGLLTRGLYNLGKLKSDIYSNFSMTMAHLSNNGKQKNGCTDDTPCTLQTVEFKPQIKVDEAKLKILQSYINSLLAVNVPMSKEHLIIGAIWWKMASCPWTCALLNGGWDECVISPHTYVPTTNIFGTVVFLPSNSIHVDPKRGFTRFRCKMEELEVSLREFRRPNNDDFSQQLRIAKECSRFFDYIANFKKILPGILDQRPKRRKYADIAFGERLINPRREDPDKSSKIGIPQNKLSDLVILLCTDLQKATGRRHLAPSLTRELRGATFLGIKYCRARAECTQCFQPLHRIQSQNITLQPIVTVCGNATQLQCPNGCRVELHGRIKWECSGLVDDGTGQAKLYAEREAALCLLGITWKSLQCIESTIWETNNADGYIFISTTPPPTYLRTGVLNARGMAIQNIRLHGKDVRNINDADVIQYIPKQYYAEYLFYKHCRTSKQPLRPLIYYVRCKPLSDTTMTLSETEIEVITNSNNTTTTSNSNLINDENNQYNDAVSTAGPVVVTPKTMVVQTYTLPPLHLNLVDCCSP